MIRLFQIGLEAPDMTGDGMPGDLALGRDLSEATPYLIGVFNDASAPFTKGEFFYDGSVIPNPYALFHPLPDRAYSARRS